MLRFIFARFGFQENIYHNPKSLSIVIGWWRCIAYVDLKRKSKAYLLPPIKAAVYDDLRELLWKKFRKRSRERSREVFFSSSKKRKQRRKSERRERSHPWSLKVKREKEYEGRRRVTWERGRERRKVKEWFDPYYSPSSPNHCPSSATSIREASSTVSRTPFRPRPLAAPPLHCRTPSVFVSASSHRRPAALLAANRRSAVAVSSPATSVREHPRPPSRAQCPSFAPDLTTISSARATTPLQPELISPTSCWFETPECSLSPPPERPCSTGFCCCCSRVTPSPAALLPSLHRPRVRAPAAVQRPRSAYRRALLVLVRLRRPWSSSRPTAPPHRASPIA